MVKLECLGEPEVVFLIQGFKPPNHHAAMLWGRYSNHFLRGSEGVSYPHHSFSQPSSWDSVDEALSMLGGGSTLFEAMLIVVLECLGISAVGCLFPKIEGQEPRYCSILFSTSFLSRWRRWRWWGGSVWGLPRKGGTT